MSNKIRRTVLEQIDLFHPLPKRPPWSSLTECVKEEVRRLLVQMLMAHAKRSVATEAAKEASDE
jgi:hypothetical protein